MRPLHVAYFGYLAFGIGALLAIAYAIPGRMKALFPRDFERLQHPPADAARNSAREVIVATGDSRLRLYLWLQQSGFYIWACGAIAFSIAVLLVD